MLLAQTQVNGAASDLCQIPQCICHLGGVTAFYSILSLCFFFVPFPKRYRCPGLAREARNRCV